MVVREKARTRLYQESRKDMLGKRCWAKTEEREDILQDLRENHQAEDHEVNRQIFRQDSKNER
jgi:hypothetical protein